MAPKPSQIRTGTGPERSCAPAMEISELFTIDSLLTQEKRAISV
jgi:hypothetical protein